MMELIERLNNAAARQLPLKRLPSRLQHPVASLTFDDFPRTAWTAAGSMLARRQVHATYYASASFCGRTEAGLDYYTLADLAEVQAGGHEIGCHSHDHSKPMTLGRRALIADARRNAEALAPHLHGTELSSYAYPYGAVSPLAKAVMGARFATCRGVRSGINSGVIDLALLKAVPIQARRWRPAEIAAWIETARAERGWLVFFTHDVSDEPTPYGCTPAMLEEVLARAQDAGLAFSPMKHAMAEAVFGPGSGVGETRDTPGA